MNTELRALLLTLLAPALAAQDAGSTFGHARTRALAELGKLPTPTDVAVTDLINFHRHRLPLPRAGEPVALDLRFGGAGFDPGGRAVLQVGFTAAQVADRRDLPPVNLGLVIDCSGSMAAAGKLDEVRRALHELARRLRPEDRVALVAYANDSRLCGSRRRGDGEWLHAAIDELVANGSTNLHGGLMAGLREVAAHARADAHNRVILLTDGIANRGVTDPQAILRDARAHTAEGVDLATIGVGRELNSELLDALARGARGMFHFVADARDVQKVFVAELEAQLRAVARDVRLRLALPAAIRVERVFGHDGAADGGELVLDLPDLNAGATQVVVVDCRLRGGAERGGRLTATARLEFVPADGGPRRELEQRAVITAGATGERLADAEVRKNFTIARVAQGLHDMAVAATAARWADADRSLRRALRFAARQFPSREDADVQRVVEMAERYREVLDRYVDRFRDG